MGASPCGASPVPATIEAEQLASHDETTEATRAPESSWAGLKNPDLYPVFALAATPVAIAAMRLVGHATEQLGLGNTMLIGQSLTAALYYYYKKNFPYTPVAQGLVTTHLGYILLQGKLDETEKFHRALEECLRTPQTAGIIIKIDAPSGDIGACQALFHEIKKASAIKPVIVLVEKQCCREAYLVASAANYIIANEQATVGSIGTTVTITEIKEAPGQETLYFYAGKLTPLGTALHHITPEEQQTIIHKLEKSYQQLCRNIAQQRKLSLEETTVWANGRPFSGTEAMELHLIDQIGTISDTHDAMARLLKERGVPYGNFMRIPYNFAQGDRQ